MTGDGTLLVWVGLDLVFSLRAMVFGLEVIGGRARRSDILQWPALALYGCYVYYAEAWRYGFQGVDPWKLHFLEAAFFIQVLADIRYYFLHGQPRPKWFQHGLWALNILQVVFLAMRPFLLFLAAAYFLLETILKLNRHRHTREHHLHQQHHPPEGESG